MAGTIGRGLRGALEQARQRIAAVIATHLWTWRTPVSAHVVIGILRTNRLAVGIEAQVAIDRDLPPIQTFVERLSFRDPYCPRCSLPLDPLLGIFRREGTHIGYQCRPCDTQIYWTPADVQKQISREVRRHYADYWRTYHEAIHQRDATRPGRKRR